MNQDDIVEVIDNHNEKLTKEALIKLVENKTETNKNEEPKFNKENINKFLEMGQNMIDYIDNIDPNLTRSKKFITGLKLLMDPYDSLFKEPN